MEPALTHNLDSEEWGKQIRKLREENGWSQKDLADRLGVHKQTVSDFERGRSQFTLERLGRILDALGYESNVVISRRNDVRNADWGPILAENPKHRRRIRQARKLAELFASYLYDEYEVESVFGIGSLSENGAQNFDSESDIDLLVVGLDPSKLFKAETDLEMDVVEAIEELDGFSFDLVRAEDFDEDPDALAADGRAVLIPREG
jgi:transcriptional regulator with XRE-family HTH domain